MNNNLIAVSYLVYNEGESLRETVKTGYEDLENSGLNFELYIFDNASTDNTQEIMSRLLKEFPKLRYVRHPENLGYSISSFSTLKIPKADYYVTVDGDGQYTLKNVKAFINQLEKGFDVVYAWRKKRNDPLFRIVISFGFNTLAKFLLRTNIKDLNCGFRALTNNAAAKIHVAYQLNYIGPEVYVRSLQNGLKVGEVPVDHFHRKVGRSVYQGSMALIRNIIRMAQYLFELKDQKNGLPAPKRENFYFEKKTSDHLNKPQLLSSQEA